jgi:hypothetical protein
LFGPVRAAGLLVSRHGWEGGLGKTIRQVRVKRKDGKTGKISL